MNESKSRQPIIDVCGVAYDADGWRSYFMGFVKDAPGYLQFFGRNLARIANIDASRFEAALTTDPASAVDLLIESGHFSTTPADYAEMLRAEGVRHQILYGGMTRGSRSVNLNDRVAVWANTYPDLIQAWAGLNLRYPDASVAELERCVHDLGMRGAAITPFWDGVSSLDRAAREIYACAEKLGVPIWIHTGMTFAANQPIAVSTWTNIDRIAVAHPQLVILVGHGGWPWILEGMAVLQRHPNVYLDFSAHRPRYIKALGSGWEPMLYYGRSVVRHKILFGSVTWAQQVTIRDLANEIEALDLGEETTSAWLHDNAARLLRLEERVAAR